MPGAFLHEATKFRLRAPKAQVGDRIPVRLPPSLSGLLSLDKSHAKTFVHRSTPVELRRFQRIFHLRVLLPFASILESEIGAVPGAVSRQAGDARLVLSIFL